MDNDDDNLLMSPAPNLMTMTVAPDQFLLSTYRENVRSQNDASSDQHQRNIYLNAQGTYRNIHASNYTCALCRKVADESRLTCADCINTGRFCSSKHDTCSSKRRQHLINMLDSNDQEEFYRFSELYKINSPPHLQCSDRMFLLKKFNIEKQKLQKEYTKQLEPIVENAQIIEEIRSRRIRLNLLRESLDTSRAKTEKQKETNASIKHLSGKRRERILVINRKLKDIKIVLKYSKDELEKKNDSRLETEQRLYVIRRQRLCEVYKYIFAMERVSGVEESLDSTMIELSNAQRTITDGNNIESFDMDETIGEERNRYRIVNSHLSAKGDYQINKLIMALDVENTTTDHDSLQAALTNELYEVLSGLSHACQLINIIAFYLHISLPFRLHQLEFNTENLKADRLRADIAKLNANIVSSCISQGICIDDSHVTHTLDNLCKLLTLKYYHSRPKPVIYSQKYIDTMEEEVNELSRGYVTEYWFDDVERDSNNIVNSDEWETVPQDCIFPDDLSVDDRVGPLANISSQQHQQNQSIMSGSIDYIRNRGSNFLSSFLGSWGRN